MERLSLIFALAMVLIVSYFFVWCGKESTVTNLEYASKTLVDYMEELYSNPLMTIGEAYARYLVENDEWCSEATYRELIRNPMPIASLPAVWAPDLMEVKGFLESKYQNLKVTGDFSFRIGNYLYEVAVEAYDSENENSVEKPGSVILPSIGVMLDSDLLNDYGAGRVYYKDIKSNISTRAVTLSNDNVQGKLLFVTYNISRLDEVRKPTTEHTGTCLVITGIRINDDHGSGTPEVELYVSGNFSPTVYNKETNFIFGR